MKREPDHIELSIREQVKVILRRKQSLNDVLDDIMGIIEQLVEEMNVAQSELERHKNLTSRYKKRMEYYKTQLDSLGEGYRKENNGT